MALGYAIPHDVIARELAIASHKGEVPGSKGGIKVQHSRILSLLGLLRSVSGTLERLRKAVRAHLCKGLFAALLAILNSKEFLRE